jgi:hemerythrin-like domain-containing protein
MLEQFGSSHRLVEIHGNLVADMGAIESLAYHLRGHPGPAALSALDDAIVRLRGRLTEHMATEEQMVYPGLTAELGAETVRAMVEDHQRIRYWIGELVRARAHMTAPNVDYDDVRWVLYVIAGLVNLHLRKEEVAYVRMLRQQMAPAAG